MEKVNSRIIRNKLLALIASSVIISCIPPFSLHFLLITFSTGLLSIISGIYGNYWKNKELTLIYHLTAYMLISLIIAFRFWDISIGLSYSLILSLMPWFVFAAILPYTNRSLAQFLYHEQFVPQTRIGRFMYILGMGLVPTIGVLGASLGRRISTKNNDLALSFLGLVAYMVFIVISYNAFYMYANNLFIWKQEKTHKAAQ